MTNKIKVALLSNGGYRGWDAAVGVTVTAYPYHDGNGGIDIAVEDAGANDAAPYDGAMASDCPVLARRFFIAGEYKVIEEVTHD